jgi:type II secretion system protein G
MLRRADRTETGFTVVEILVATAIIGILAAVALPNLLKAVRRAKQRQSMCDMRTLGTALEAYAADRNMYPAAACFASISLPRAEPLKPESFASLAPTYIATPPVRDGWGRVFGYSRDATGSFYLIQSRGEDGGNFEPLLCGPTDDFNADIAYSNGSFVQWPRGGIPPSALSKLAP